MKNLPVEKHFLELTDSQEHLCNRGAKASERLDGERVRLC